MTLAADHANDLSRDPFADLKLQAPDALLSLIKAYRLDPRPGKIDLGVGVYRDARGATPVFHAVKAAEAELLAAQDTKAYLGPEGDLGYLDHLSEMVLGDGVDTADLVGMQTPGGTGALRLAAEMAAMARPGTRIWLGTPTWPNHPQIFEQAGLTLQTYRHFDPATGTVDFEAVREALSRAQPGDLVLLHGCCHNPTGADFTPVQWKVVIDLVLERRLIPLIDLAYQGLGFGLDEDAAGARALFAAADNALIAYSCDKNFGLYRERTGALFARARWHADTVRSTLHFLARCAWSMPPDHGAAVVRLILESPELSGLWRAELTAMRQRLTAVRSAVANALPALQAVRGQHGLFSLLPLTPHQVEALRRDAGVYMAGSGRINVAGLNDANLADFVAALSAVLA